MPLRESVYITVEGIIKFKETPCRACAGHSRAHSAECRKRFSEPVSADRAEAAAKSAAIVESKDQISKVATHAEEFARAIHASELEKDPESTVRAEDFAREFDEAGPYFDAAPASTAAASQSDDVRVYNENANCLIRYHIVPRQSLFTPKEMKDCPVSLTGSLQLVLLVPCFRGASRRTFMMGDWAAGQTVQRMVRGLVLLTHVNDLMLAGKS